MDTNSLLPPFIKGEGGFTDEGKHWDNSTLYKAAEGLEPFDIPVKGIYMGYSPWGISNVQWFCHHMKRVLTADYKYPIILSPDGVIIDGWHRVAKAIIDEKDNIKAVRLIVMPEPDETNIQQ